MDLSTMEVAAMNRDTYEKLCKMRLPEMASQYRKHAESPELYAAMTFDEEFELLVDAEFDARTNNKIKRLLKNSSIPDTTAHIGGIGSFRRDILTRISSVRYRPMTTSAEVST